MTIRDRAKRRPQIEALEVRETPSGSAHHVVADLVKPIKFTGTGTATTTSVVMTSPGVEELSGPISGTVSTFGTFSGSHGVTDLTVATRKFTATAVVTDPEGDSATLNTRGTLGKSGHATSAFSATDGTGNLVGYTATGTVKTTVNLMTGAFTFTFSGKAKLFDHRAG